MPRRPRIDTGGLAYHVLNRGVGRMRLFDDEADYDAFTHERGKRGRESY